MTRGVLVGRAVFGLLGVPALAYGVLLVWQLGASQWVSLGEWLLGSVVGHDFVIAPILVGLGVLAAKVLPSYARMPVAVAVVVWGSITLAAIPVLGGFGASSSLPSLLNRPYVASWWIGTAIVVTAVVAVSLFRRRTR